VKKIVSEDSPLVGSSISESGLSEKGALVLGIERGKNWIPIPKAREIIESDDRLIVYGPHDVLKELSKVQTSTEDNKKK
jgi:uncharacterized protein with PhoU and TrkA domain